MRDPILGIILAVAIPSSHASAWNDPQAPSPPRTLSALLLEHDRSLLDAIECFLGDATTSPDREEAHRLYFDLAIRRGWYERAAGRARDYLRQPPFGEAVALAQLIGAMDDARSGRLRAAIVLYRSLLSGLDPERDLRLAVDLADTMADTALAADDSDAAREIYACLLDRFGAAPDVVEKSNRELARIDLLGTSATAVDAVDLDGRPVVIGGGGGHQLLVFWATWSDPCRIEIPVINEIVDAYRPETIEVIGVALDATRESLAETVRREGIGWRQVHAATSGTDWTEAFDVSSVPCTILLDPEGTIIRLGLLGPMLPKGLAEILGPPDAEVDAPANLDDPLEE